VAVGARRTDRLRELEKEIIKNNVEILIQKLDVTIKSDCDSTTVVVVAKWGKV
jgi:NADP-dependent 3-hydroxy acid dehydrogenase YdfG